MIIAKDYYFSPIGNGEKIHIFRKGQIDRALCLKGPSYWPWHEIDIPICNVCLREYQKEVQDERPRNFGNICS